MSEALRKQFEKESGVRIVKPDWVYKDGKKTKLHRIYYWRLYAKWFESQMAKMPTDLEIETASAEYDKRAHIQDFHRNDPEYHFEMGINWLLRKLEL